MIVQILLVQCLTNTFVSREHLKNAYNKYNCCEEDCSVPVSEFEEVPTFRTPTVTVMVSEPLELIGEGKVAKTLFDPQSTLGKRLGIKEVKYSGAFPAIIPMLQDVIDNKEPFQIMSPYYLSFIKAFGDMEHPIPSVSYSSGFLFMGPGEQGGDKVAQLYEDYSVTDGPFVAGPLLHFLQQKMDERATALSESRILLFPIARNTGSGVGFSSQKIEVNGNGELDLSWVRGRVGGFFAEFLKLFGATVVGGIGGPAIVSNFESGNINFAEFNNPTLNSNVNLNSQTFAPYYYMDNIQEQTSFYLMFVNENWWNGLDAATKLAFHVERRKQLKLGYEEILANNARLLSMIPSRGIQIMSLSHEIKTIMNTKWQEFAFNKTTIGHKMYNADFKTVYDMLH